MNPTIDTFLQAAFQQQNIIDAYVVYKRSKWDKFSGLPNPRINVPIGADGVTSLAFEKQIQRLSRNISARVLGDKYIFYPFREVEKLKKPELGPVLSNIRTLGVASIRDALVQAILYEYVLYKPMERLFGELDSPATVSYAYRKTKSAPLAAKQIHEYLQAGYVFGYDFDLSKYFDSIPHDKLLQKVAEVIGGTDSLTYRLVRRYVRVDRVPYCTYRKRRKQDRGVKIFHTKKPKVQRPKPTRGVPQGGILSGMLANLYLHEFDRWVIHDLGSRYDLRYVRYADDFIILVRSDDCLADLKQRAIDLLGSPEFDLVVNSDKTKPIDLAAKGLDFVGFHFDGKHIRVKQANIDKFVARVGETLTQAFSSIDSGWSQSKALKVIARKINAKIQGFHKPYYCPICQCKKQDKPRNWTAFFSVVTDDRQLRQLDKEIRRKIYAFIYSRYNRRLSRKELRKAKIRSLVAERYRVRNASVRPCLCQIENASGGMWQYASDLYQGRRFATLDRKRPFYVPHVGTDSLQISVGGRQYHIHRDVLQDLWVRLRAGEVITRKSLEVAGMRNTSHIVVLLSELPGVTISTKPIRLRFQAEPAAPFLRFNNP